MNKIYKVIWSKVKHCYVVVSELAKSHGKTGIKSRVGRASLAAVMAAAALTVGTIGMDTAQAATTTTVYGASTNSHYAVLGEEPTGTVVNEKGQTVNISSYYELRHIPVTDNAGNPVYRNGLAITKSLYVLKGYDAIIRNQQQIMDTDTPTYKDLIVEVVVADETKIPSAMKPLTLISAQSIVSPITDSADKKVTTVLGTALNSIGMSTYIAAADGGTLAEKSWDYIIEDTNGKWVNLKGTNKIVAATYNSTEDRFYYTTTDSKGNTVSHAVSNNENVYYLTNSSTNTTSPYVFLRSDGSLYTGTVRGFTNEILMTAEKIENGNKVLYTYWGAKLSDDQTLVSESDITVGDLNKAFRTFEANDKNLAQADITNIKLTQQSNGNGGTLGMVRNNNASVLGEVTISSTGGTKGQDVKVQFSNQGVKLDANGNYISDPNNTTTFTVDAGSKVVANNGGSGAALKTLSVNGTTYSIVDTDTNTQNTVSAGNNVSITTSTNTNGTTNYRISATDTNTVTSLTAGTNVTVSEATDNQGNKTYTINSTDTNNYVTGGSVDYDAGKLTLNREGKDAVTITGLRDTTLYSQAGQDITYANPENSDEDIPLGRDLIVYDTAGNAVTLQDVARNSDITTGVTITSSNNSANIQFNRNNGQNAYGMNFVGGDNVTIGTNTDGDIIFSATDTNTITSLTAGNNVTVSETIGADGNKTYTINATDTDTNTQNTVSAGNNVNISASTNADGTTNYQISAVDTDTNTITSLTAGTNVTVSETIGADGNKTYTINATDTDTRNDTFVGGAVADNQATVTLTDTKGNPLTATITNIASKTELDALDGRVTTNITNLQGDVTTLNNTVNTHTQNISNLTTTVNNNTNNITKLNAGWNAQINGTTAKNVNPENNTLNFVAKQNGNVTIEKGANGEIVFSATDTNTVTNLQAGTNVTVTGGTVDENGVKTYTISSTDTTNATFVGGAVASNQATVTLTDTKGNPLTATITDIASAADLNALDNRVTSNTTNITNLQGDVTTINNTVNTHTQNISNLTTQVESNTTNITDIQGDVNNLTTKVTTNETNISNLTNTVNAGWDAQINGTTAKNVNPTNNKLNFVADDNVTITTNDNGEIVFSATDTNTYLNDVTVDKANNKVDFTRNDGQSFGINFEAGGGTGGNDTYVQIGGANGLTLNTGSKVEGTGKATPNDKNVLALSGITINGEKFLVPTINANVGSDTEAPYLTSIELNGKTYNILSEGAAKDLTVKAGTYTVSADGKVTMDTVDSLTGNVTQGNVIIDIGDYVSGKIDAEAAGATYQTITNQDGSITNVTIGDAITTNTQNITNLTETVNKGWNLKVNDGEAQNVELGDTVTLLDGDNMVVTSGANGITFATKKDVAFGTVSVTDTVTVGNIAIDKANGIGMSGMKITNLAAGEDGTDAVNVSQLNQKVTELTTNINNSKTVVEAGNNVTISSETDQTTGQVTYIIDGKKTTVSTNDTNLTITAGTEVNGVTDYNVSLNESIILGNTAANQVMINGLTGTLKLGNTVVISTSGINMGGMSITNLSAGVNDTDAVNVSQLNDAVNTLTANDNHLVVNPNADAGHYAVNKADDTVTLKVQGKDANGGTVYTDVVIDDVASATELDALGTRVTTNETNISKIQGDITNIQGNITNIGDNITNIQKDITKINTAVTNNTNTINNHETRIDAIEDGYVKSVTKDNTSGVITVETNKGSNTFTDTYVQAGTYEVNDNQVSIGIVNPTDPNSNSVVITDIASKTELDALETNINNKITNIKTEIGGLTDTTLVNDANGLTFDKGNGNLSMTVTDTSGKSVTGTVNIDEYVSDKIDEEAAGATYQTITNEDGSTTKVTIGDAITTNTTNIAKNATDIAQNKDAIAQNAKDIATNAENIASNTDRITTIENTYVKNITQNGNTLTITQGDTTKEFTFTDTNTTNAKLVNEWNGDDVTLTLTDSAGKQVSTTIEDVAKASDLDKEISDRAEADMALNNRINREETLRAEADAALNDRINREQTERVNADTALNNRIDKEISDRAEADTALNNRINREETIRAEADTALNDRINREQTERVNADTALNSRIDQEIIDRQNNDIVAGAIDREAGTVTLTKGDQTTITLDGNLCDSRLDNVTYDEDAGKLTFTVTDHYTQDQQTTLEVDGIASEKALEKETSERQAMDNAIINDYTQRTDALSGQINTLGHRMTKAVAGAAALAALHPLDFDPDDKLSFSAGVGNYGGSTAAAIGAFYRPNERVMFSIGGTVGNGEEMVNAGVSFALGKGGKVNTSRVAMTHEINDLRQQVAYLSAVVAQLASQNGYQFTDMKPFPDTAENHWAYEYVAKLAAEGIVEGYPSGNFDGDRTMTRYEFAAMLFHALEKGITLDTKIIDEFEPELGRLSVERIKGEQNQKEKIERVRVNDSAPDRDVYGGKINVGKNWP